MHFFSQIIIFCLLSNLGSFKVWFARLSSHFHTQKGLFSYLKSFPTEHRSFRLNNRYECVYLKKKRDYIFKRYDLEINIPV